MDVTQTSSTAAQTSAQLTSQGAASALSSDFETFLTMLTVQMQNQDPLNPIESSDYAVQLATFSGVEQQVRTNTLLESLAQQSSSQMVQLAGWVGMEARADVPGHFDGSPITLFPQTNASADAADLVVRNADGVAVQRLPLDPSVGEVTWAGVDGNGTPLPEGDYSFVVVSYQNGTELGVDPVELYDRVSELRMSSGGIAELVFASGGVATADSVSALRDPG